MRSERVLYHTKLTYFFRIYILLQNGRIFSKCLPPLYACIPITCRQFTYGSLGISIYLFIVRFLLTLSQAHKFLVQRPYMHLWRFNKIGLHLFIHSFSRLMLFFNIISVLFTGVLNSQTIKKQIMFNIIFFICRDFHLVQYFKQLHFAFLLSVCVLHMLMKYTGMPWPFII